MKITVLFPTHTEASLFKREGVNTIISGVGLTATTYATMKAIQEHQADILILAGIAGVYQERDFKIKDVVLVESEVEADLGFFTPDGFVHMAHLPIAMEFERRHTLHCPHLPKDAPFRRARSASMNAAMAPFINISELDIENMEGAAFFHVCQQEQQRFLELRAVSNFVKIGEDEWDMQGSIEALTQGLHQLIDHLQNS
jgi:futalosine hydrolase